MPEYLPIVIAVVAACIAVYTDMKKRIIPNRLNYPLIVFGILYYLVIGAARADIWTALSGVIGAAISFGIGYFLWFTGGWAGGDVKLFTAFGALLPFYKPPTTDISYPFPITILFNSVIVMLPVLLVYSIIRRSMGKSVLYEEVKVAELKEGMIPAELVYEKDGKIFRQKSRLGIKPSNIRVYADPSRAAGLTRHQVGVLKGLARERKISGTIKLKKGMPFAPALAAGMIIGVVYADFYWILLRAFVGG
jgi:Flp pilus assembly protein protease CpaA